MSYQGQHRMGWREAREIRRAQRVTVADMCLALYDWARVAWRNLAASMHHGGRTA